MGWTSYVARYYKNGKVDRKREMDERFTQHEHDGSNYNGETCHYPKMEVLKSSMIGSTYYAAVRTTNTETGYARTWAAVCLTSTKWRGGMNFGYKDMDETMHPYCYDCPKGILDLLSPTDNEDALAWRKKCEEKRNNKKPTLSSLPVGTMIKYTRWDGKEIKVYKHPAGYQFKRPFWMLDDGSGYISQKHIPENYEIVEREFYYTDSTYGGKFTYEEMIEDAKKNYDYGDPTNFVTYMEDWWKELGYKKIYC